MMIVNTFNKKLLKTVINYFGLKKRFRSDAIQKNVRVRFAPSPTGDLHLGGLKTALYNYLFAKSNNGTFIMRVEDTDLTRKVEGAAEKLMDDLKWCGIHFDEGPYYQSENTQTYKDHAKLLVDNGKAYYCFCTEARLDLLRRSLIKSGEKMKYDNKCRNLTKKEVESRLRNNERHVIRFKLTDSIVDFNDLIFGYYNYNVMENEGDPVILKSDGYPTYHLANVVDDHNMGITHVLRGSEWLISTTKHMLIFKAFDWECPQYGHLPLLIDKNKKKFSKRDQSVRVQYMRERGIFPRALINFLTRIGGGFEHRPQEREKRILSMEEFIQQFDITKVNKNSIEVNMELLLQDNQTEIRRMLNDEKDVKILMESIRSRVKKHFEMKDPGLELNLSEEFIMRLLYAFADRIKTVEDLYSEELAYIWTGGKYKFVEEKNFTADKMRELINDLSSTKWESCSLSECLRGFSKNHGLPYGSFMENLRSTLTSSRRGLPVSQIFLLIGKESTMERLKASLES